MEILKISWEDIEAITGSLAHRIKESGFVPDYVIGITTGGLIPLYYFAKEMDVGNILTVSARSYEKDTQGELVISYLPEVDLTGKNVLLVDEISDTGKTLQMLSETICEKYGIAQLKTVTIAINKTRCKFVPDYYGIEDDRWIVFPWENKEFPEYFSSSNPIHS